MALSVGTVVAGYTVEAVLGSGGMGVVYRAAHPSLPRSDAMKILSEEFSRDEDIRVRFLREADLAATLDHPNVVPSSTAAKLRMAGCGSPCSTSRAPMQTGTSVTAA